MFLWRQRSKAPQRDRSFSSRRKSVLPLETDLCPKFTRLDIVFSYLRQENSTERVVPTFSVWYRAWLSGTVAWLSGTVAWLSGTNCLVLPFVLLFIYVSNYDVTTQSATFPATSEGYRDVKENIIGIFLFLKNAYLKEVREK